MAHSFREENYMYDDETEVAYRFGKHRYKFRTSNIEFMDLA
jgi:hypothetical protein